MSTRKKLVYPKWMSDAERDHFDYLITNLKNVEGIDYPLLWSVCQVYEIFRTTEKLTDKSKAFSLYQKMMAQIKKGESIEEEEEDEETSHEEDRLNAISESISC